MQCYMLLDHQNQQEYCQSLVKMAKFVICFLYYLKIEKRQELVNAPSTNIIKVPYHMLTAGEIF